MHNLTLRSPEAEFAAKIAAQAGALCARVQNALVVPTLSKGDKSPVTAADFAAQALVAKELRQAFPDAVLVGEEDAGDLRSPEQDAALERVTKFVSEVVHGATQEDVCRWIDYGRAEPTDRFWTLDPVDGTKGFLRGEQYAVALALIENGRVQVGALACPNLTNGVREERGGPGTLILAVRGHGAWMRPMAGEIYERIHVSHVNDAARATLLRSVESGHTNVDQVGQFALALGTNEPPACMDSQAKYAVLAAGGGELLVRLLSSDRPNYRERIWDQAAGALVLEEAGGRITDLDGMELDFGQGRTLAKNRGVLATNGHLHDAALGALRRAGV